MVESLAQETEQESSSQHLHIGSSYLLVALPSGLSDAFCLQEHLQSHAHKHTHNKIKAVSYKAFFPLFWIIQKKAYLFLFSLSLL